LRNLAIALEIILILSIVPSIYSLPEVNDPSSSQTLTGKPSELKEDALERGRALFRPLNQMLSGASALVTEGIDFRLPKSKSEALNEFKAESSSPILQAASASLVPYRDPTQKFSRNLLLTRDLGQFPFQTEPSISVNPKNPDHLIVGVIDYNSPNVVSYVSIDRGATWEGPFQPRYLDKDLGAAGDPVVAFDRKGNAYISSISIGIVEFSVAGIPFEVLTSGIAVTRSPDGGFTWDRSIRSSGGAVEIRTFPVSEGIGGFLKVGFLDKPWMIVGPSRDDSSKDTIYVTYTNFVIRYDIVYLLGGQLFYFANPVLETTIEIARSEDQGKTWSKPMAVSPTVKREFTGSAIKRVIQGSQPAVGPDGTVYLSWFDSTDDGEFKDLGEIWVVRSDNGGRSFSKPILVDTRGELAFSPRTANFRAWASGFPQIAVGPTGQVSIAYGARPGDKPTDDGDIFIATSSDKGENWTRKRINDDETDRFQFFPAIAYDPKGAIHAMWGDFRDDKTEKRYHIYYSKSEDGGNKWSENARVTDFPSNPNRAFPRGLFIGDYFSIQVTKDDVYMVWADGRLGEFGSLDQKIGFARLTPMPSPSILVSPSRGAGGSGIQIQGFDFQPDIEIFVQISGAIITSARTDKDGRFLIGLFIPIAGEGAQEIRIIDATGNVAVASFFMDVGFNTINKQLNDALGRLANIGSVFSGKPISNSSSVEQLQEQLGNMTTITWIATGLSATATLIAVIAMALILKRLK
jgi:hypothetical protein